VKSTESNCGVESQWVAANEGALPAAVLPAVSAAVPLCLTGSGLSLTVFLPHDPARTFGGNLVGTSNGKDGHFQGMLCWWAVGRDEYHEEYRYLEDKTTPKSFIGAVIE